MGGHQQVQTTAGPPQESWRVSEQERREYAAGQRDEGQWPSLSRELTGPRGQGHSDFEGDTRYQPGLCTAFGDNQFLRPFSTVSNVNGNKLALWQATLDSGACRCRTGVDQGKGDRKDHRDQDPQDA